MLQAGVYKNDITAFKKGVGMLGYGMYFNTMEGIATPLYARAFVVADSTTDSKVCIVVCELGFITMALKKGVLQALQQKQPDIGIDEENLMLLAQHTHSGPGGFSYYGLYSISIPGFVQEIYDKLVATISDAIIEANKRMQHVTISYKEGQFELATNVAFNRSLLQYNQNPEVTEKITQATSNKGVNRTMQLIDFINEKAESIGSINWFGVHTTSVSNDNLKLCSDNKGYAAQYIEDDLAKTSNSNYVGAFAQGSCGDISPRFRYNPKRPYQRGKWEGEYYDDFDSAKYNGKLQYEKAKEILGSSPIAALSDKIDYTLKYVNFTDITCLPKYTGGKAGCQTGFACQGMAFFGGARVDGPGAPKIIVFFGNMITAFIKKLEKFRALYKGEKYKNIIERKYRTQGKKAIFMETHAKRVMGTKHVDRIFLPAWIDPSIHSLKDFYKKDGYKDKPWTAKILPLQIIRIGQLAICGFPFEITTIAAKRLRNSLLKELAASGITEVILAPYANSYSGYITTNEEYQVQMYEGGHTVFGEWSLAALQTKFDELTSALNQTRATRTIANDELPPDFTVDELNQYPFYKRNWYLRQEKRNKR